MKNVNDYEREIERRNWLLAAVLVLSGVFVGLSTYFEVLVTPAVVVASIVAVFCGFVCMMQTVKQSQWGYNPVKSLWIPVSVLGAVICFGALICSGFFAENIMKSLFYGGIPLIVPIFGWLLGMIMKTIRDTIIDMRYR